MLLSARNQTAAAETAAMPGNAGFDSPADAVRTPLDRTAAANKIQARVIMRLALMAGDLVALALAFGLAALLYQRVNINAADNLKTLLYVTLPIYIAVAINGKAYDFDSLRYFRISAKRALVSFILTVGMVTLAAFFLKAGQDFSRMVFGIGTALGVPALIVARLAVIRTTRRMMGENLFVDLVIRDEVAYTDHVEGVTVVDAAEYGLQPHTHDPQCVQRLGNFVRNVDRVVVLCPPERRAKWAFVLKALDINAEIRMPELDELGPVALGNLGKDATMIVSTGPLKLRHRLSKRIFDAALVLAVLPFLALPMLLVALLIKLETPGPVLFKQVRIGLGNRPFHILKFRSMRVDLCDAQGNRSAARDDDRITRVGAFIRRTSIDELPQILNVLMGDMSIVGPRPHAVGSRAENMLFWDIDDRYWHRHAVKPGLTGLAQIRGYRGATEVRADLSNRLQADLEYRANWSLVRDISIILATFKVLVHRNAF